METLLTTSDTSATLFIPSEAIEPEAIRRPPAFSPQELAFEIGAWLSGIRSFISVCQPTFAGETRSGAPDLRREFRLLKLVLIQVSTLLNRLRNSLGHPFLNDIHADAASLDNLSRIVRDSLLLAESHSQSASVSIGEWQAFAGSLVERLESDRLTASLHRFSIEEAYDHLPPGLRNLFERDDINAADRVDFFDIVPKVAASLRYLDIVGQMMREDEPIKPGLVILAAVHDQVRSLIDGIDLRLVRDKQQDSPLFNSLDSASYVASLELKKIFGQELRGIVGVASPTSVFARMETAYYLLLDSLERVLLDLARTIDPAVTAFDHFPRFRIKLDQSLILREHLWQILKAVKAAEESPVKDNVDGLKQELADFVTITIRFLHYKDEETFERFSEEVHAAGDKKDLVPVLHRFGAYLETLFGQVCMRADLADHPFQPS